MRCFLKFSLWVIPYNYILQRYEKYDFYGLLWFKKRNIVIYNGFEKTAKLIVEKCVKKY